MQESFRKSIFTQLLTVMAIRKKKKAEPSKSIRVIRTKSRKNKEANEDIKESDEKEDVKESDGKIKKRTSF